jgi:nucleotide-binding universal stress UspA family protein
MDAIVVGFDGSPAAERALERAATLSSEDGRVVIVTASVSVPSTSVVEESIVNGPSPAERDALLERAATTLRSRGIEPTLVAADADPTQALVEAARAHDAALIVVGSTGTDYAIRVIIGSTAENFVRLAPCDVLVVR